MTKIIFFRVLLLVSTITIATSTVKLKAQCSETFEGLTPPALPIGWSASTLVDCTGSNPWQSFATTIITGTRTAFVTAPECISDEVLYSRYYSIGSSASELSFTRRHGLEEGWDGMVLEISIGGAGFVDILVAGGSFSAFGYNLTLGSSSNPLSNRQVWSGSTGNVTTIVNLPASANGQVVRFRWRRGTDSSVGGTGVYIDNITITGCIAANACAENFGSVTAPALPSGWSAVTNSDCAGSNPWITSTTLPYNSPNSAYVNAPNCISDEFLYSKLFLINSSPRQLSFRRKNDLEGNFDGLVLEISIDGAPFIDVLDANCAFVGGGYNSIISNCCGNPLSERSAWTGDSGGWVLTTLDLPASAVGKIIIFRWRRGTDYSEGTTGAYIDDISVIGSLCNTSCSGNIALSQSSSSLCTGPVLVTASGGGVPYQWYKNHVLISGETGSTYTAVEPGIYYTKSLVSSCMVTSNIVVVEPGSIQPILGGTGVHCQGDGVSVGMPETEINQQYTWRQNGIAVYTIPVGGGGGNQSLNFTMEASRAGTYRVETSIPGCVSVYTNNVFVAYPAITGLQTVSLCNNEVKVKWNRVAPLSVSQNYEYDLSLSSTPGIADGQTSDSTLTLTVNPSTSYYLHVRSACGFSSGFGNWVTLSFITPANGVSLTVTPSSGIICDGAEIQLTVTGGGPVYSWYLNNELIPGANNSTYVTSTEGEYQARSFIGACEAKSNLATLESTTVVSPSLEGGGVYCTGALADMSVFTQNEQSYTWKRNGVAVQVLPIGGGGGNQSLAVAVNSTTAGNYIVETTKPGCPVLQSGTEAVYQCKITNLATEYVCANSVKFTWTSTSNNFEYIVNQVNAPIGTPATTSSHEVIFSSLEPLTTYFIHVQGEASNPDQTSYCAAWSTISFTTPASSLLLSPAAGNLCDNLESITLTATGGGPVYEWYKDGALITGATGAIYNAVNPGEYQVKHINGNCTNSSNVATLEGFPMAPLNAGGQGTYCGGTNADINIPVTLATQDYTWRLNGVVQRYIPIGGGGGNQSLNVTVSASTQGLYTIQSTRPGCPDKYDDSDVELSLITGLSISSICPTQVNFEWNNLMSNNYQYEVSTSSFPPGSSSNPSTSSENATVNGLTPSTLYYIHVRGSFGSGTGFCGNWTTISFNTTSIPALPVSIWTGDANNSWTNPGNWLCGLIPGTTTEVVLNGGRPNYPVVSSNRTIRKMTVNPGATVTVSPGIKLTITGN